MKYVKILKIHECYLFKYNLITIVTIAKNIADTLRTQWNVGSSRLLVSRILFKKSTQPPTRIQFD